jgi:hypothetical protein
MLAGAISRTGSVAQGLAAWWWPKASRSVPDTLALLAALERERDLQQARSAFMVWLMTVRV